MKSKTELQDRSGHLQQELLLRHQDLKRCTSTLTQIREDLDAIHLTSRCDGPDSIAYTTNRTAMACLLWPGPLSVQLTLTAISKLHSSIAVLESSHACRKLIKQLKKQQ